MWWETFFTQREWYRSTNIFFGRYFSVSQSHFSSEFAQSSMFLSPTTYCIDQRTRSFIKIWPWKNSDFQRLKRTLHRLYIYGNGGLRPFQDCAACFFLIELCMSTISKDFPWYFQLLVQTVTASIFVHSHPIYV